jgi:hypothetical protein
MTTEFEPVVESLAYLAMHRVFVPGRLLTSTAPALTTETLCPAGAGRTCRYVVLGRL